MRAAIVVAVLSLCVAQPASAPRHAASRIGVFPVARFDSESDAFLTSLDRVLRDSLEKAGMEIVALPWPDRLADSGDPTFETLVHRGRELGCNGVLALRVRSLSFTAKTVNVPLVGRNTLAEANFRLAGGLVDVTTGAAVAGIQGESRKRDPRYGRNSPDTVIGSEFGNPYFDDSLLADAANEALGQVVAAVGAGLSKLTPASVSPPARTRAPEGIGFGQDAFSMTLSDGYDHRGVVSVVNRGTTAQSFTIAPLDVPKDLVVGLLGEGSAGTPATLAPGQWKDVRFIANVPGRGRVPVVKLALFTGPAGEQPSSSGPPADVATMNLKWEFSDQAVTWNVLGQDPVTLAYTCELRNNSNADVWDMSVDTPPEYLGRVWVTPQMQGVRIPANSAVNFSVVPGLQPGMETMEATLEASSARGSERRHFRFVVPQGKSVYFGLGHTGECSSSGGTSCANQKEIEYDTDGSKCAYNSCFRQKMHFVLGNTWVWILKKTGNWPPVDVPRERAADVRGATVRANVAARLPNMETDSVLHPMASAANDATGFAYASPGPDKRTAIYFAAERPGADRTWTLDEPLQMSAVGHSARWPYLRARRETSQAYLVWEDATADRNSDVAFRASAREMKDWKAPQYLTGHGRGVDDPVVQVDHALGVAVTWSDLRDGSGQVYVRVSRDDGTTFEPERALERSAGESQTWPQFAFTQSGFRLVWVSKTGAGTRVLTRELNSQGVAVGTPAALSHAGVPAGEPQVACEPHGPCFAVWREGDGHASEIWFSRLPAGASEWTEPKALTKDAVYSEYPLVWLEGRSLYASYHRDAKGLIDLKYILASDDGGETWREARALPSLQADPIQRAYLQVRFSLQNPRASYQPFDSFVFVNDVKVGELRHVVPEGIYVFEVPPGAVEATAQGLGRNRIRFRFDNLGGGHYILATDARLTARRRYTQRTVVASSQAEADELVERTGFGLNHSTPDLALGTDPASSFPVIVLPGQKIDVRLQVFNVGEGVANDVRVAVYSADPRGLTSPESEKLGELRLGSIGPGQVKPAVFAIPYNPSRMPRLYGIVSAKEKDYYPGDNISAFSFAKGESNRLPPLFGTDIPDLVRAPDLLHIVSIPNARGLSDMLSIPGLDKLLGRPGFGPLDVASVNGALQGKLGTIGLQDLNRLIK